MQILKSIAKNSADVSDTTQHKKLRSNIPSSSPKNMLLFSVKLPQVTRNKFGYFLVSLIQFLA